jgi:hypothetical protein
MNLLADESVEALIVDRLRKEGHGLVYVAELAPGVSDEIVLNRANEGNALLITADKDFGELVYRRHLINADQTSVRLPTIAFGRRIGTRSGTSNPCCWNSKR